MKILEALDKITKELNNSDSRDKALKDNLLDLWYIYSIGEAVEKGILDNIELDSIDNNIAKTIKNMLNKLEKTNKSIGINVNKISNIEEINGKKCGVFTLNYKKQIISVVIEDKTVYSTVVTDNTEKILKDLETFGFNIEIVEPTVETIEYYEASTGKLVGTIKHKNGKVINYDLRTFKNYINLDEIFKQYNQDIKKFNGCMKLIADLKIVNK